jgi:hypothetical protein
MKKFVFALLLALGLLPSTARAQFPGPGFWQPQFQAPVEVTGDFTLSVNTPVVAVTCSSTCAITLSKCWPGQVYTVINSSPVYQADGQTPTSVKVAPADGDNFISPGTEWVPVYYAAAQNFIAVGQPSGCGWAYPY